MAWCPAARSTGGSTENDCARLPSRQRVAGENSAESGPRDCQRLGSSTSSARRCRMEAGSSLLVTVIAISSPRADWMFSSPRLPQNRFAVPPVRETAKPMLAIECRHTDPLDLSVQVFFLRERRNLLHRKERTAANLGRKRNYSFLQDSSARGQALPLIPYALSLWTRVRSGMRSLRAASV